MQVGNQYKGIVCKLSGLKKSWEKIDVLTYFKETKIYILCLQDTHVIKKTLKLLKLYGMVKYSGSKTNSRGVEDPLNNKLEYKVLTVAKSSSKVVSHIVFKLVGRQISDSDWQDHQRSCNY